MLGLIPRAVPLARRDIEGGIRTDYSYEELRYILKDADVVFHLAGKIHGTKKELEKANVELTENIVNAIPDNAKLIVSSSISVYGKNIRGVANEETPLNPDTPYAVSKAKQEEVVEGHRNRVILRIATLYGENFLEYFKLFKMIEKGKHIIVGEGKNKLPLTYVKDVAKAMKNSIKAKDNLYVLSSKSIEQEKAMKKAAILLGKEFKPKRLSLRTALLLAKANGILNFSSVFKEEFVLSLASHREFSSLKAEKELGFKAISPEKGIRLMIEKYKEYKKMPFSYKQHV